MNKLIVTVPGLEGTYEFEDISSFTNRELHRIKMMTGLRMGEFEEAFAKGDNDVLVALAAVILKRQGRDVDDDLLWDAPAGTMVFDFTDVEDPTQGSATTSEPSESESSESEAPASGNGSETHSVSLETDQRATGLPDSQRSVISDPETLVS